MRCVLFIFLLFSLSCSSGPLEIEVQDYDQNSKANGAAYSANAMEIREPMPSHSDWKPFPFYYKHCSEMGEKFYYSKTAYECSDLTF